MSRYQYGFWHRLFYVIAGKATNTIHWLDAHPRHLLAWLNRLEDWAGHRAYVEQQRAIARRPKVEPKQDFSAPVTFSGAKIIRDRTLPTNTAYFIDPDQIVPGPSDRPPSTLITGLPTTPPPSRPVPSVDLVERDWFYLWDLKWTPDGWVESWTSRMTFSTSPVLLGGSDSYEGRRRVSRLHPARKIWPHFAPIDWLPA